MIKTYNKFQDIPQFVSSVGKYDTNFRLDRFILFLDKEMVENGYPMDLDPDYQRPYCWTEEQEINWIEFILRGGQSGRIFYFNDPNWSYRQSKDGKLELVDGKQRLKALRRFINNEIKVFGTYYKDYEDRLDYCKHNVIMSVNNLATRKEVLKWYLGLNGGGMPHTKEELDRVYKLLDL